MNQRRDTIVVLILALLVVHAVRNGGGGVLSSSATAAVYVYEKDDGAIPAGVLTAFDKLNRQNIRATSFEEDTKDGTGDTPDQYKVPLAAASEKGLPAMAVMGGDHILRVVKNPQSEADVMGAVK